MNQGALPLQSLVWGTLNLNPGQKFLATPQISSYLYTETITS